jgi:hypothetical protein
MSLKVYTFYTDSHEILLEKYFKPSFYKTNSNLKLIVKKFEQNCYSGDYMSKGWCSTMMNKVNYILESIEETWGEMFVHADCDINFFSSIEKDLKEQLGDCDMAAQDDGGEMCCGFFICKSNEKTKNLFENVKKQLNENYNDQQATNKLAKKYISKKLLDEKYYSIYRSTNKKQWNPSTKIELNNMPKKITLHHSNWTVGVENKIKLFELIKEIYNRKDTPYVI